VPIESSTQSIFRLIADASLPTLIVLFILLGLSVFSWAIILNNYITTKRWITNSLGFLSSFRGSTKLEDIHKSVGRFGPSPVAEMFIAAYTELTQFGDTGMVQMSGLPTLERVLKQSAVTQMSRLELGVSWLATIGTASPFIGLFGTVVGIIIAFQGLSSQSQTSIQAVAPGIAEALVATAMGLFAAVPAYMAHNYFVTRIRLISSLMDDFALEVLNMAEKGLAQYGLYRS
jgi:biopolymer transport protein TolQ